MGADAGDDLQEGLTGVLRHNWNQTSSNVRGLAKHDFSPLSIIFDKLNEKLVAIIVFLALHPMHYKLGLNCPPLNIGQLGFGAH